MAAFAEWSALPFTKRAHYLEKAAEIFEAHHIFGNVGFETSDTEIGDASKHLCYR